MRGFSCGSSPPHLFPPHMVVETVVYPELWVAPSVADVKINWIGG